MSQDIQPNQLGRLEFLNRDWPGASVVLESDCAASGHGLQSSRVTSPWGDVSWMPEWTTDKWKSALSARGTDVETEAYQRLGGYLFAFARRYVKGLSDCHVYLRRQSEADLDDLTRQFVQGTLEKVWSNYESFGWRSHVKTWATTILIREIQQFLRKSQTRKEILVTYDDSPDTGDGYIGLAEKVAQTATSQPVRMPEASITKREFIRDLEATLAKLSRRQRYAFVECCLRDRLVSDVAQELNTSVEAVYQHVSRARRKLRGYMRELGYDAGFGQ